jgi:hypothetical protein
MTDTDHSRNKNDHEHRKRGRLVVEVNNGKLMLEADLWLAGAMIAAFLMLLGRVEIIDLLQNILTMLS